VFVIAHRRLLDERRKHARRPDAETLGDTLASSEHVEADAAAGMSAERVRSLCAQLPIDQGDVLVLRILGDCTIDTIAQVLGRSVGAVKQLQRRGLDNLRRLILEQRVPL
jgi:RNA polymerase sigma-70 factor (ECF subfamily)